LLHCWCAQNKLSEFIDSVAGERLLDFAAESPQEDRIVIAKGRYIAYCLLISLLQLGSLGN